MTFYVVLQLIKKHKIDPKEEKVVISAQSTKICGTSAGL